MADHSVFSTAERARSTSFGLRPVSTRTTSAWQFVERPILAAGSTDRCNTFRELVGVAFDFVLIVGGVNVPDHGADGRPVGTRLASPCLTEVSY
jgi:hypothetical protein